MTARGSESLTVVIPVYREAPRIAATIEQVLQFFGRTALSGEVIVVDDGSDDGTIAVVETAAAADERVKSLALPSHRGKGAAVREGLLAAAGAAVLVVDADLAIPLEEYPAFAEALRKGADIAIASKELGRRRGLVAQPFVRTAMGRIFNAVVRAIVLPGFLDTQAGFKLFKGAVAASLAADCCIDGFAYDVEILSLAVSRGYNVVELPVRCSLTGATSVRIFSDSLRMLKDLLEIRRRAGPRSRRDNLDAQTR